MATPASSDDQSQQSKRRILRRRVATGGRGKLAQDITTPGWLRSFGGYFAGAYRELRQVRWPNRRATWGMTSAVIIFTLVMSGFVLALDYAFETLFKRIIT